MTTPHALTVLVWRHPRPAQVAGRCIGQTDVPVDRRKAKRLAHRVRQAARRLGCARVVHTSPLQRCALVGRILRGWGWRHHVHMGLLEMAFGRWDGQAWQDIPQAEVDAWCADFLHHAPGGGEPLAALMARVQAWVQTTVRCGGADAAPPGPQLLVGHAGWMLALQWQARHLVPPVLASQWPPAPPYGGCFHLAVDAWSDAQPQ